MTGCRSAGSQTAGRRSRTWFTDADLGVLVFREVAPEGEDSVQSRFPGGPVVPPASTPRMFMTKLHRGPPSPALDPRTRPGTLPRGWRECGTLLAVVILANSLYVPYHLGSEPHTGPAPGHFHVRAQGCSTAHLPGSPHEPHDPLDHVASLWALELGKGYLLLGPLLNPGEACLPAFLAVVSALSPSPVRCQVPRDRDRTPCRGSPAPGQPRGPPDAFHPSLV